MTIYMKCDNCPKEEIFNGWTQNKDGISVFLCGKCQKEDNKLSHVISNEIYKTKEKS